MPPKDNRDAQIGGEEPLGKATREQIGIAEILGAVGVLILMALGFLLGGPPAGFVVIGATMAIVLYVAFGRDRRGKIEVREAQPGDSTRRILVVAHAGLGGPRLAELLDLRAGGDATHVHVIVPAEASPLKRLASDVDEEIAAAESAAERLRSELQRKCRVVTATTGDTDPRLAVEDALKQFPADEVVIVNPPTEEMDRLERTSTERAFDDIPLPVREIHA